MTFAADRFVRTGAMAELFGQALRFGIVGLANTAIGVATIAAMLHFAAANPFVANGVGHATALGVSFLLNRSYTFRAGGGGWPVGRFLATFLAAYSANSAVLALALQIVENAYLAQAPALVAYSAVFFVLSRWWVFRPAPVQAALRTTTEPAE